jgi:hypothetical protein
VGREQHGCAPAPLVVLEIAPDHVGGVRIERGGRLIEQQQLGPVDQGLRQQHPGLLPGRQPAGRAIEEGREIEVGGERLQTRRGFIDAVELGVDPEVLADRQPRRQVHVGRGEVDPAEHAVAVPEHVLAQHRDPAGARLQQPQQHRDGRGLAGAVGAEQRGRGADRHGKAQVVDREHVAIALAQVLDLDRVPRMNSLDPSWT